MARRYERNALALRIGWHLHHRGAHTPSAGHPCYHVYGKVYGDLMRTNIVLDDALVAEASRLSGITTKKDLVAEALRVFIASKKRKNLLDLRGKIEFAPDYDYKALRHPD
jgi:Arc/MetJ family transcription regulator